MRKVNSRVSLVTERIKLLGSRPLASSAEPAAR